MMSMRYEVLISHTHHLVLGVARILAMGVQALSQFWDWRIKGLSSGRI